MTLGIDDKQFNDIISSVMDELPQDYIKNMQNVAITYQDNPTEAQEKELKLRRSSLLLGLFEGVPKTESYGVSRLPSKITLFKNPLLEVSADLVIFREQVKRTLWHEIAHYYGLNHARINQLEKKNQKRT
jgi:predicted Zn-dependent protease with MMP-like domain